MKVAIFAFFIGVISQQLTPIPSPIDGFNLGPTTSSYILEVFYDHLCPDSAAAYPGLYAYWQANQAWLGLTIHIFPLPYHSFSFVAAQAGKYIQVTYPSKFISYLSFMFTYQNIINTGYPAWDFATVQLKVAGLANQATNISTNEMLIALNNTDINWDSRVSWKYAASRGMVGTPLYILNDIWVPEVSGYVNATQWTAFFQGLN